jgi:hypothetical protein
MLARCKTIVILVAFALLTSECASERLRSGRESEKARARWQKASFRNKQERRALQMGPGGDGPAMDQGPPGPPGIDQGPPGPPAMDQGPPGTVQTTPYGYGNSGYYNPPSTGAVMFQDPSVMATPNPGNVFPVYPGTPVTVMSGSKYSKLKGVKGVKGSKGCLPSFKGSKGVSKGKSAT